MRDTGTDAPQQTEIYVEASSADSELARNISAAVVSFTVTAGVASLALQVLRQALRRRSQNSDSDVR
ncbi:MAG: hypothetical protein F4152_08290 [Dehalococcoidia bacterium]|nr:hypothetical protein [Dehalococcoidia bacterium]